MRYSYNRDTGVTAPPQPVFNTTYHTVRPVGSVGGAAFTRITAKPKPSDATSTRIYRKASWVRPKNGKADNVVELNTLKIQLARNNAKLQQNLINRGPETTGQSVQARSNKVWKREDITIPVGETSRKDVIPRNVANVREANEETVLTSVEMAKRGDHSLVLKGKKCKQGGWVEKNIQKNGKDGKDKSRYFQSDKRRRMDVRNAPKAKRIRLTTTPPSLLKSVIDNNVEKDQDQTGTQVGLSVEEDTHQKEDSGRSSSALTDFAYMETCKTASRAHGPFQKGRSKDRVACRNMGLVRVRSEEKQTPVCRSFARGIPCTNQFCSLRHDVPPECAVPLCSFFQRNGQCMRRDSCPFRHIKVDPRAAVCSSFSLLGYCEDKDCKMKHMRK